MLHWKNLPILLLSHICFESLNSAIGVSSNHHVSGFFSSDQMEPARRAPFSWTWHFERDQRRYLPVLALPPADPEEAPPGSGAPDFGRRRLRTRPAGSRACRGGGEGAGFRRGEGRLSLEALPRPTKGGGVRVCLYSSSWYVIGDGLWGVLFRGDFVSL